MSSINALISLSPQLHGSLRYQVPDKKDVLLSAQVDPLPLRQLYQSHLEAYPKAGKAYAATRTWSLMYWQPAMLSVLSVHGLKVVLRLDLFEQHAQNGSIYGYFFSQNEVDFFHENDLIAVAATRLKTLCEGYYDVLSSIAKVPHRNAYRLLADSVLTALNRLSTVLPVSNQQILMWSNAWLEALGLSSQSRLMPIEINKEKQILGLDRIACCMHYLRDPDDLCLTCPKQCKARRIERIKQAYLSVQG
ncbi:siderophore ferric iron reductase [uncultured Shewanella sp.]|uniref:siderophore ferric iron reductase n=1 Tax=uncultured Shewanella sp. TaxID=173975 RepID=UPI00262566AB|nr:siderophore ferric iron reductase [uncultured Shewanella sp.]